MSEHHEQKHEESQQSNTSSDESREVVSGEGKFCPINPPENALEMLMQLDQMFWAQFQGDANSNNTNENQGG